MGLKIKIAIAVIFLASILMNGLMFKWNQSNKDNADSLRVNLFEQADSLTKVITVTEREFKMLLKSKENKIDSILKEENIRKKKVRTVTVIEHHYHMKVDTMYVPVESKGSISDSMFQYYFHKDDGCLSLSGDIYAKTKMKPLLAITESNYNTEITNIAYLKKKWTGRRFLWVFKIKKEYIELHSESTCGENKIEQLEIKKE